MSAARQIPVFPAKPAHVGVRWVGERTSQPTAVDPRGKSWTAKHFERMLKTGAKPGGFFGDWIPQIFGFDAYGVQPCGLAPHLSPGGPDPGFAN